MKNLIRKILREDKDWDFMDEVGTFTVESLKQLLSDCSDLQYMIYRIDDSGGWVSTHRGKPATYYLSTCDYWVNKFPNNEWIAEYSEKIKNDEAVVIIWTNNGRPLNRDTFNSDNGSIIVQDIGGVVKMFVKSNRNNEYHFFVNDNNEPIWDLILPKYREGIRDSLKRLNTPMWWKQI